MSHQELSIREATNSDADAIKGLVFDVLTEYGITPSPEATDADLDDIERRYLRAGGTLRVITTASGTVVGCGGLLPISAEEIELRKMYLRPEFRGRGLGRLLLDQLVDYAKQLPASRITLETAAVLKEAIGLYSAYGFVRTETPNKTGRCDQTWELRIRHED